MLRALYACYSCKTSVGEAGIAKGEYIVAEAAEIKY